MRYLRDLTRDAVASYIPDGDPAVEMYDDTVRIFDQHGGSLSLRQPLPRQLRALAFQLEECAAEIERRAYEEIDAEAAP
jgi:hypothetical protein